MIYEGSVRVPDEVGQGKATITLSFPDWKEGKVAPATFEVPITKPKPRGKAEDKEARKAAELLERGRQLGDWGLLSEVMTGYPHTAAGVEATALLADYQARGQCVRAAVCFKQLFQTAGSEKLAPLTLVKAAIAFRTTGDGKLLDTAWKALERKVGRKGLKFGQTVYALDDLKREIEKRP